MSESVKVEIQIGKSQKEACDLLVSLFKALVKDKKNAAQVAAENFPAILMFAGHASQIPEEIKAESEVALGAYLAIEIEKALK